MNRFRFVGKVDLNALDSKVPFKREGKTKNGDDYASFNCIVVPSKNNRAFCEVFGQVKKEIETYDTNGDKLTIPWADRFNAEWLKQVTFYRQFAIKLGDERHAFVTEYDFVKFLISNASLIKGKNFIVTGSLSPNVYNGKVSQRFQLNNMIEVDGNENAQLEVTLDYFWTADSIDIGDWTEKKVININGYINESLNKDNKNKYVLHPVVFDASKIDFEDEDHLAALNMKLKQIGLEFSNGSIKNRIKKESVCKLPFKCRLINGAEEVEFNESQLSENQRAMIACGLMSLDDFRPKGSIFGKSTTTYKLYSYDLRDDYADGFLVLKDYTPDDLKSNIYSSSASSTTSSSSTTAAPKEISNANGVDLDDLFG